MGKHRRVRARKPRPYDLGNLYIRFRLTQSEFERIKTPEIFANSGVCTGY